MATHTSMSQASKMKWSCPVLIKPDETRAHVGGHILRAMRGVREQNLHERVSLPNPCGFGVDIVRSDRTYRTTSTCMPQPVFAYGHAKKCSAATPSTNVPIAHKIAHELYTIVSARKTCPAFWKYSILSRIQSAHLRYWNDLDGDFATKTAISREELDAFRHHGGIALRTPGQCAQQVQQNQARARGYYKSSCLACFSIKFKIQRGY
ncbi:hypothetical protein FB451DRAFT_1167597 [Mycena latifolia]|nr:hypothetical protein FB451DRAFT_1167597 [Mycena latifolia]